MQNINSFKISKKLDVYVQADELNSYIKNFINQSAAKKFISYLSRSTNIPEETIEYETKQYLSSQFEYVNGRFSKKFKIINIFKSIFVYLSSLVWIFFFSKNKKKN